MAALLKRHTVNRISLGIQSFKEEIVFETGRCDTEEDAMRAINLAKSTGADVNIDLISGLAGETVLLAVRDQGEVVYVELPKVGSSVAQALRVQSDSMRVRRRQLAEEKAAKEKEAEEAPKMEVAETTVEENTQES